jgi:hypothetical protein
VVGSEILGDLLLVFRRKLELLCLGSEGVGGVGKAGAAPGEEEEDHPPYPDFPIQTSTNRSIDTIHRS